MTHNKKRNTAFLFDILLKEATKATLSKDIKKAKFIKETLIHFFNSSTEMKKELDLYSSLKENVVEQEIAEKYLQEVKSRHDKINKVKLFNEKSSLINIINKHLGPGVFNTFVPSYKDMATISQIFNIKTPIKEKILLENKILEKIIISENKIKEKVVENIDSVLFRTFSNKFNDKYKGLLTEQRELLTKFVGSMSNDGLELKVYLNEEISRLAEGVKNSLVLQEISSDAGMKEKTEGILSYLKNIKEIKEISQDMLQKIIKIQQFVHEVSN